MDNCTTCNDEIESTSRQTSEKAARKEATVPVRRATHAFRLLHALLLIAFGALVIGLMAANAFGSYMKMTSGDMTMTAHGESITSFEILTDVSAQGDRAFVCIVFLLIFAIAAVGYGFFMLFTQKTCSYLKLTTILLFYLPVFIIMCAFSSYVRTSVSTATEGGTATVYTELEAGGISIFVLSVGIALIQAAILFAESRIRTAGYATEVSDLPEKPYVVAEYPYPEIPHPNGYTHQELADYYGETLPQFNKGIELMKEHHPQFAETRRAAMKEYHAECRRIIGGLYQQKHNATCAYPIAYLWWNFSE